MNDEITFKVLKIIEANPEISQRQLAEALGISLGKTNFCLKALVEKGIIKSRNFKNNQNKIAYCYCLTPKGLSEKAKITANFLKRKLVEYESLKREIEFLQHEVEQLMELEDS